MTETFQIQRPPKIIDVEIAGRTYTFRRPKKRSLILAFSGINPESQDPSEQARVYMEVENLLMRYTGSSQEIIARLEDDDDEIDIDDIMLAFQQLMGKAAGVPPTQP
jgi:hypothetical protein